MQFFNIKLVPSIKFGISDTKMNKFFRLFKSKLFFSSMILSFIIATPPLIIFNLLLYFEIIGRTGDVLVSTFLLFLILFITIHPLAKDFEKINAFITELAFNRIPKPPTLKSYFGVQKIGDSIDAFIDIWQQNKNRLSIQVIERKLILDTIPNGIIILDDQLIVRRANDAAHNFLGASIIGQDISTLIEDKNFIGLLHICLHEKRGKHIDVKIDTEVTKSFSIKIEPMNFPESNGNSILVVLDDISEISRTEKSFTDFVTNASHEIRTPLAGIMGITETLLSNKDDKEALDTFLPMLHTQANRIKHIIEDLLTLASIERQLKSRPSQMVTIYTLIDEIEKQFEWDLNKNNNKLIIKIPTNLPNVMGDYNQLVQVFYNLISNAIKYGKPGGEIEIMAGIAKTLPAKFNATLKNDQYIYVTIKDHGDGIKPEYLSRLTERFFRIDSSRSQKITGTGLGLSIVQQIINRHSGFLNIKSKINVGTEFSVYLPIYKKLNSTTS